ncbi:hypothetical protein M433DRAFT_4633 [Acidomyces richmondensis BFW]|nr:MAG: hypothetical protein FE78DRAFT_148509 [Acidomyces sp. 'richmondensis']KYG45396.1 hypothetical protein M433DRAFT_4633 [Acidomyces richmondensis BFW]
MPPLFSAVAASARQLSLLLRCISFANKAEVRISAEGIRFSTEEGSVMEAFIFLEKALFTSFHYHAPPLSSSQDDPPDPPVFEINLQSLLETLHIFSLSDPAVMKRPGEYDALAAHRLQRHANLNVFSDHNLGITGVCTFTYDGAGRPLSIHLSEGGVTTSCDLTLYEARHATEDIPFDREALALKAIIRASHLLDAVMELSSMSPPRLTIIATPSAATSSSRICGSAKMISFSATGALGSAVVDFIADPASETSALETFQCQHRVCASFDFRLIKATQRAMAAATKVSLRLDDAGVLSLQFLVEVDAGPGDNEAVTFVDFRIVPLIDEEGEVPGGTESDDSE